MSGLPSAGGGHGAPHHLVSEFLPPVAASTAPHNNNKRKRRPAGTPDPDAEVVALSPKTLMESDRYVCEICNQGFQRDQNLQMHRRRHKVPWKLLKKPSSLGTNKRVYICPERSCLHHDPTHALGDLVGIKKHYRRKHCTDKQWKCVKCTKRYAVQSDYKAHLKTCGTRGHCCDCGRVFSRVESFIEHQDTCGAVKHKSMQQQDERKPPVHHQDVHTDRISDDSRSESSDTMSFAPSGISDTATNNSMPGQLPGADSRRILETQSTAAYNAAAMPAWLMPEVQRGNTKLELQQQQSPPANSDFRRVHVGSTAPKVSFLPDDVNTPSLKLSIGRTGSVDQVDMPCLRLSIGPSSAETAASSDTKPEAGFGSIGRESFALRPSVCSMYPRSTFQGAIQSSSKPLNSRPGVLHTQDLDYKNSGNDLALWIPEPATSMEPAGTLEQAASNSLWDFLAQAWRPGGAAMQGCVSR